MHYEGRGGLIRWHHKKKLHSVENQVPSCALSIAASGIIERNIALLML